MNNDSLRQYLKRITPIVREKLNKVLVEHIRDHNRHYLNCWEKSNSQIWFDRPNPQRDPSLDDLADLHGFWMLWLDDTRNSFSFPFRAAGGTESISFGHEIKFNHSGEHAWRKALLDELLSAEYALSVGGGSVGLALRLGRGVCLRDTVRDTRGSVATEDFLTRNFSYIGVPIWRGDATSGSNHRKPVLLFSLLFPARGAWHADELCCCLRSDCGGQTLCLYKKIQDFCNDELKPLAMIAVDNLESKTYQSKVMEVAALGDEMCSGFDLRRRLLDRLVQRPVEETGSTASSPEAKEEAGSSEGTRRGDEKDRDLLGFRVAALFEGGETPEVVKCTTSGSYLDDLFRHACRNAYAESVLASGASFQKVAASSHPTDRLATTLLNGAETQHVDLTPSVRLIVVSDVVSFLATGNNPIRTYWSCLETCCETVPKEMDGDDVAGMNLGKIKWVETVLTLGAELLVYRLTGKSFSRASHYFSLLGSINENAAAALRQSWLRLPEGGATLALVTKSEAWHLTNLEVCEGFANLKMRMQVELSELPFTRRTLFRLVTALEQSKKLQSSKPVQVFVDQCNAKENSDSPLRSETSKKGEAQFIDFGAMSAVNDVTLLGVWNDSSRWTQLTAWNIERVDGETYKVALTSQDEHLSVRADLVSSATAQRVALAMAESVAPKVWDRLVERHGSNLDSASGNQATAAAIIQALRDNKCGQEDRRKGCFPFATKILDDWHVSCTGQPCQASCPFMNLRDQMSSCATTVANDRGRDALALGINSYLIVPLLVSPEDAAAPDVHGFLLLGSAKREYDTVKRVTYSPAQIQVVRFAADYLELTIGQEKQADATIREKAAADAVRHLEGIEPEVRSLVEDITQMKWRAERIGRRISPASFGVFAYDSETASLFDAKAALTVDFDSGNGPKAFPANTNVKDAIDSLMSPTSAESTQVHRWKTGYTLSIRKGEHLSPTSFVMHTLHNPSNVAGTGDLPGLWPDYRRVFFLLGMSRGNIILKELGLYQIADLESAGQSRTVTAEERAKLSRAIEQASRLFNAAKLIFHRFHAPGNEDLNAVYTVQLLAAFAAAEKTHVILNDIPLGSAADVIKAIATLSFVDVKDACDSQKWLIGGPARAFLQAISQFVNVELQRRPESDFERQSYASLHRLDIKTTQSSLTLKIECTGSFDENNLHYLEENRSGEPDHGLTHAFLTVRQSFRRNEGDPLWSFSHKPENVSDEKKDIRGKVEITLKPGHVFTLIMPIHGKERN